MLKYLCIKYDMGTVLVSYKEMEKQISVMKEYMEKQGIRTRETDRTDKFCITSLK